MEILYYNHLDYSLVKKQYDKIVDMLRKDDFYSAEIKKLTNTPYYRAKLDDTNRLLFKIVTYGSKRYALLLEVIHNHAYDKSRFLNGAQIQESKIITESDLVQNSIEQIIYVNQQKHTFNILDKVISFDEEQDEIFSLRLPLMIIGSAGSGKTMLTLEKMKECRGDILYVTHSPYLVENSRNLYYANQYNNDDQNLDFLSYNELLETVKVPEGKEIGIKQFSNWLLRQHKPKQFNDANKLYEEFKGVITGTMIDRKYLSREDYISLGIKQSIFNPEERAAAYDLFERYLKFLSVENLFDSNIVSYEHINLCKPKYDFIVVDEIQDFTNIQLYFILKLLNNNEQFILSGDSNQIVHPNFFSWSKVKSMFYQNKDMPSEIIRILRKNYRNAQEITDIANNILRVKNKRFGSVDRESNYLVNSCSSDKGSVRLLLHKDEILFELNIKTKKSTKYAVIVLRDELKSEARKYFQTPLIFSIQEAKGLEYENVILYNFVSCEDKKYYEVTKGVGSEQLSHELVYSRVKDKLDRSLEIYKFYINALYVAVTRAVKSLYIIEISAKHRLLELLSLKEFSDSFSIATEESSLEEWRREAHKLELQGKNEQAEDIRHNILDHKKTPWQPIDQEVLKNLKDNALKENGFNKEDRLKLFEYAVIYRQDDIIEKLRLLNFRPAHNPDKAMNILISKYFMFYNSQNLNGVIRETDNYGIDFRNPFNLTPLMSASIFGNVSLIKYLVDNSADITLRDSMGRNALQISLEQAYSDKKYAATKLSSVYKLLVPSSISIKADGKLIKIDNHTMEFFMFNLVSAILYRKLVEHGGWFRRLGFCTDDFINEFKNFPDDVLFERRKKRSYISSILSKNEINRQDKYNRKLFLRIRLGYYTLNPQLEIKVLDNWIKIYDLLQLDFNIIASWMERRKAFEEEILANKNSKSLNQEDKPKLSEHQNGLSQPLQKQMDLFDDHE